MDLPQHNMNVWVTLATGEEVMAYCIDGQWWTGVPDNGEDVLLAGEIVSWREVTWSSKSSTAILAVRPLPGRIGAVPGSRL